MKYYIISGEASGDLHGSNLVKRLRASDQHADLRGWGGDLMSSAGVTLVKHYRELAFMGFSEVLMNLPTILRNIKYCKKDILHFRPDILILIDYPGFNLRIAAWARQQGLKVVFYISPQVWAWKENRVRKMKQCIDKMICILPFEKEYYKKRWNWDVEYVGHPLVAVIEDFKRSAPLADSPQPDTIALLPGSRKQEISKKLPIMLEVAKHFPAYRFVVAQSPGQDASFYTPFLAPYKNVSIVNNQTYALLLRSKAALVTSGTATLETALFGVPEVVCYKGSNISYQIAKRLINIPYISLVNLIMGKMVVKELIQDELTSDNLANELHALLENEGRKATLQKDYAELKNKLSESGDASTEAAGIIYRFAMAGDGDMPR